MAPKKTRVTKARAEKAKARRAPSKKEVSRKKDRPDKEPAGSVAIPAYIYSRHALASLRIGLRHVAKRSKRYPRAADRLISNLAGPLRALEYLFQGAKAMFEGGQREEAVFRKRVLSLIERAPSGRSGLARLRARAAPGAPAKGGRSGAPPSAWAMGLPSHSYTPDPEGSRRGCSIVRPEGMTTLVLGVARLGLGKLTQPAMDAVAELSIAQGHLELLSGTLVHQGVDGLEDQVRDGASRGDYGYEGLDRPVPGEEGKGGGVGLTDPGGGSPEPGQPDDPFNPDDPLEDPDLWGRPDPEPFLPDTCEMVREACEAMFMEAVNEGLPSMPLPPGSFTWADNIESIELPGGYCEGDRMIVHGHDFGITKPANVELVMHLRGGCSVVETELWTDTRIEALLPARVTSGSVGFYDPIGHQGAIDSYNDQAGRFNRAARDMMVASKCMGQPMLLDTFPSIPMRQTQCPPNLGVNYVFAGSPIIRGFIAATDSQSGPVIVVDPDDNIVLRWTAENAVRVRLLRISPDGPAIPGSPLDVTGQTSYVLGQPSHTGFTSFAYRLVADNACGSVTAEVNLIASKRPGLAIKRIEVTQSIQNLDNSIRLVAEKPTVVRVYVTHALNGFGDDTVPGVTGSMTIYARGIYKDSFYPVNGVAATPPDPPPPDRNASITVIAVVDPPPPATATNDTLNFVIPASLAKDILEISVHVSVSNFGSPVAGAPGFNDSVEATFEDFQFIARKPVKLRFIPATVTPDAQGNPTITMAPTSNPPTNAECRDFLIETMGLLPVIPESIERLEGFSVTLDLTRIVLTTPWGSVEIPGASESLVYDVEASIFTTLLGALRLCELGTIFGVCTEDHDAIWAVIVPVIGVWGLANGIPGREYITPFLALPSPAVRSSHELSHCLNQQHLANSNCAGGGNPATSGDAITDAANWEDRGQIVTAKAVPFDVIRNITVVDATNGVFDLMTYCPTRWVTSRRWDEIFDYVGGP